MTEADFLRAAELLRGELVAHCYRLSGSIQDAEDLVQEAMLRGWRSYASFRGEATVRTWLYRIATNAFLSSRRPRRRLPSDLGPPTADISLDAVLDSETPFLQPLPDALVFGGVDPAAIAVERDRLRLALVASLQRLPARQRSALLLREALDYSAAEIGETLGISVPAVKSLLQRARAALVASRDLEAESERAQDSRVVERYMRAFESSDPRLLEQIVRDDAMLEMPPARTWFQGRATCLPFLRTVLGHPGEWSMRPSHANGAHAVVARRDGVPFGVAVLGIREGGLARISLFTEPVVVERFVSLDG